MKNTISFLFILLVFQVTNAQTLDATLAELNFHEDSKLPKPPSIWILFYCN
jgi:hypothetical protein